MDVYVGKDPVATHKSILLKDLLREVGAVDQGLAGIPLKLYLKIK